jgi:hypothetical protein
MFIVCTISINLHADVIECEVKEETGTVKVLGNSGDEVIAIGFNDLTTEKTVNGVTY